MVVPIKKIEDLFERADVGLNNAKQHELIIERISTYGFDIPRIDFGLSLLETARASVQKQLKKYAEQQELSMKVQLKRAEAHIRYISYVKIIRRELNGDVQVIKSLGLTGKRLKSYQGFIEQSTQFYTNAINDDAIFAKIEPFVVSKEKLQEAWDLVNEYEVLNRQQEEKKGEAQDATDERDKDVKALRTYMTSFTTACRATLKDQPQLLEKLKIRAYSKGYKKKKEETADEENPQPEEAEGQTDEN